MSELDSVAAIEVAPVNHERKDCPQVEVDTPIGKLYVMLTGKDTISVRTPNQLYVTVNRVNYSLSVHLKRVEGQDGPILDLLSGWSINRENYWKFRENATDAARMIIKQITLDYAKLIIAKMPHLIIEAECVVLNNTLVDLQAKEEEIISALRKNREEQDLALQQEEKLKESTWQMTRTS